jgi:hypothetical protein
MYQIKGRPVRVFDKDNQLVGIFDSENQAVKKVTDLTYKQVKDQIRKKQKTYAAQEVDVR